MILKNKPFCVVNIMKESEIPDLETLRKKIRQKRKNVIRYEHYPNVLFNRKRSNVTLSTSVEPI